MIFIATIPARQITAPSAIAESCIYTAFPASLFLRVHDIAVTAMTTRYAMPKSTQKPLGYFSRTSGYTKAASEITHGMNASPGVLIQNAYTADRINIRQ